MTATTPRLTKGQMARRLTKGQRVAIDMSDATPGKYLADNPWHGLIGTIVRKVGRYQVAVKLAYPPLLPDGRMQRTEGGDWDPIYYFEVGNVIDRDEWNAKRLASIDTGRTVTLIESKVFNDPVWGPMETETALIDGKPSTVIRQQTGETLHAVIVNTVAEMDALIDALQEARAVMADPATYLPANI